MRHVFRSCRAKGSPVDVHTPSPSLVCRASDRSHNNPWPRHLPFTAQIKHMPRSMLTHLPLSLSVSGFPSSRVAGGSIGRRSGGRRDGGGVYPTAAAALGLGLTPHHDFEEKSETAATGGASVTSGGGGGCGGSSAASTASNNNTLDGSGGLSRRRSGRGGAAGRGSIGSAAAAPAGAEGGFFYIAANGGVTGAGGPVVGMGAPGMHTGGLCWFASGVKSDGN